MICLLSLEFTKPAKQSFLWICACILIFQLPSKGGFWIQIPVSPKIPDTCSLISNTCCLAADRWESGVVKKNKKNPQQTCLLSGLTRWGWLDLDLLPAVPSSYAAAATAAVCWRLFSPLHLTLVGEQILDVLLLERAGGAAGRTHVQVGGQLAPLLVLVHLSGGPRLVGRQDINKSKIKIIDHNESAD